MQSWFAIYFPVKNAVHVVKDESVTLHFWRQTDTRKVWYEWAVVAARQDGTAFAGAEVALHNPGGRSYWVGL